MKRLPDIEKDANSRISIKCNHGNISAINVLARIILCLQENIE